MVQYLYFALKFPSALASALKFLKTRGCLLVLKRDMTRIANEAWMNLLCIIDVVRLIILLHTITDSLIRLNPKPNS